MRWKGRRQSSNIEDRRGRTFGRSGNVRLPGGSRRIGGKSGGGISAIILLVVGYFVLQYLGIDPAILLSEGGLSPSIERVEPSGGEQLSPQRQDEMTQFVATVLAETEDTWAMLFSASGVRYSEPTLVLFEGRVSSACGRASSATGPFYCPGDQKIYIDLAFYNELANRFGAAGDFAQAYVIAHEVGHHVQNLIGVLPEFNRVRRSLSKSEENQMSVRVELQADCFAGIWAHHTQQKGLVEKGDIEEALNVAHQVGDDTIQLRARGYVVPESFNHGTSEQRTNWFARGFDSGRTADCDTFDGEV
ncbi:KPN_02809 family neutral zinc metallopeptidase [Hoeflea poritis]|uniref:Zinc metallopeptidase n=1 Tax=Hoeflea poritis TaxID=2993659 RepID=A0ABT4VT84_9HYPH|nr:neutral zinc metallopeptidase [Hoeflea poritis]MDA4847282.1 zinc metallopeptidase [Hoeflea poritis]